MEPDYNRAKPSPPELIPGLPGINAQRLDIYRHELVSWKAERADRLLDGIGNEWWRKEQEIEIKRGAVEG